MPDINRKKFKKQNLAHGSHRDLQIGLAILTIKSMSNEEIARFSGYTTRQGLDFQFRNFLKWLNVGGKNNG